MPDTTSIALWFAALVVLAVSTLGLISARNLLTWLRDESRRQRQDLSEQINQFLPQTQCGQCGYAGCAPYARAIADGDAINRCPPGGNRTIRRLAELLQHPPLRLDPAHGSIQPARTAYIHENQCIGCTKCIQACPVDAILGGPKLMHTVIVDECTGCDLCVDPCPVDCIEMIPLPADEEPHWSLPRVAGYAETISVERGRS